MKTITVKTKKGINYSYNNKDYPYLDTFVDDNSVNVHYTVSGSNNVRKLLVIPFTEVECIKYKYTD